MMSIYNTIYDFVKQNRVEVTCYPGSNVHNCYINFKEGDKPWGSAINILDAIDRGVVNYINYQNQFGNVPYKQGVTAPYTSIPTKTEFKEFAMKDGFIFWYWFSCKHNISHLIQHYEEMARREGQAIFDSIRYIVTKVQETVENIATTMDGKYPAIYNLFIQPVVYYESLKAEKYENLIVIRDILDKSGDDYKREFNEIQEKLQSVETEILKTNGE